MKNLVVILGLVGIVQAASAATFKCVENAPSQGANYLIVVPSLATDTAAVLTAKTIDGSLHWSPVPGKTSFNMNPKDSNITVSISDDHPVDWTIEPNKSNCFVMGAGTSQFEIFADTTDANAKLTSFTRVSRNPAKGPKDCPEVVPAMAQVRIFSCSIY